MRDPRRYPLPLVVLAACGALALVLGAVVLGADAYVTWTGGLRCEVARPRPHPDPCADGGHWADLAVARVSRAFPGRPVALAQGCTADPGFVGSRELWARVGGFDAAGGHTRLVVDTLVRISGDRAKPEVAFGPYQSATEALAAARYLDGASPLAGADGGQVCVVGWFDPALSWGMSKVTWMRWATPAAPAQRRPWRAACRPARAVSADAALLLCRGRAGAPGDGAATGPVTRMWLTVPHPHPLTPALAILARGTRRPRPALHPTGD